MGVGSLDGVPGCCVIKWTAVAWRAASPTSSAKGMNLLSKLGEKITKLPNSRATMWRANRQAVADSG